MKRTLFLVAATAAVLALPATASAFRGVAVAKDQARHSVVVAAKGGVVRTVRAPRTARLDPRSATGVTYSARRLSDGTFRATSHPLDGPRPAAPSCAASSSETSPGSTACCSPRAAPCLSVRAPARGLRLEPRPPRRRPRRGARQRLRQRPRRLPR